MDSFAPEDRYPGIFQNENSEDPVIPLLGVQWHPESDTISYKHHLPLAEGIKLSNKKGDSTICLFTKRELASVFAILGYDPPGLISPLVLPARDMLQRTWAAKLPWDSLLPEDIKREFSIWLQEIKELKDLTFTRHVPINESSEI